MAGQSLASLCLVEYCHNITNTKTSFAPSGVESRSLSLINLVGPALQLYSKCSENLINNRNICSQIKALRENQYSYSTCPYKASANLRALPTSWSLSIVLYFFVQQQWNNFRRGIVMSGELIYVPAINFNLSLKMTQSDGN